MDNYFAFLAKNIRPHKKLHACNYWKSKDSNFIALVKQTKESINNIFDRGRGDSLTYISLGNTWV